MPVIPARTLCLVLRRAIACQPMEGERNFSPQDGLFCRDTSSSANAMIPKLASGKYRLYSRKKNPKTGHRRNLGTFSTRTAAEKQERAVQFYKRH